jgi:hypothetical protein
MRGRGDRETAGCKTVEERRQLALQPRRVRCVVAHRCDLGAARQVDVGDLDRRGAGAQLGQGVDPPLRPVVTLDEHREVRIRIHAIGLVVDDERCVALAAADVDHAVEQGQRRAGS